MSVSSTPIASPERQTNTDLVLEPPLVSPGCDAYANANETSTPPNGKANRKPSKKKTPYDHNKLKEALKWYVNHRGAKSADAVAKFSPSLKASIYRRVKEMNLNQLRNGTDDDKQKALDAIDALEDKLRANNSPISERKWLTEAEEEVFIAKIEQLGAMGFPVRKDVLAHDMLEYVRKRDGGKSYDSLTGKERKYSDAVVARFLIKHKDCIGSYCSSNLGEERGEKATMEIMQQFFDNVFTYCEEMITEGVFPSDWKTVADIPGANKYNMDEMNKSTKQNRSKIIASKKQKKSGRFEGRFFESSDGDHQPFHVSLALTTRGDGAHGRGFTPGPMLIYSSQSKNKTGTYSVKERHLKHIATDMDGNPIDNKHNFQLSVNENGSMTLDLFLIWAKHFVEHLPEDQGKDGLPVLLFFDGHTSRWTFAAMEYLRQNNVHCFCLPSHTSIWSQPNDAGVNRSLNILFGESFKEWKENHPLQNFTISDFNEVMVAAWEKFLVEERTLMARNQSNNTSDAFEVTGIHPPNPRPKAWMAAITTIGGAGAAGGEEVDGDVTYYRLVERADGMVVAEDQKALLLQTDGLLKDAGHLTTEKAKLICAARAVGKRMLAEWRKKKGSKLHLPLPSNKLEEAAFSVVEYQSYSNLTAASRSEKESIKNQLSAMRHGDQFNFTTKDNCTGIAQKLASGSFYLSHAADAASQDCTIDIDAIVIRHENKDMSISVTEPAITDENRRAVALAKERIRRREKLKKEEAARAKAVEKMESVKKTWEAKSKAGLIAEEFQEFVQLISEPYQTKIDGQYCTVPWNGKNSRSVGEVLLEKAAQDILERNRTVRKRIRREEAAEANTNANQTKRRKVPNCGVDSSKGLNPEQIRDAIKKKQDVMAKRASDKEERSLKNGLKICKSKLAKIEVIVSKMRDGKKANDITLAHVSFALKEFDISCEKKKPTRDDRPIINPKFDSNVTIGMLELRQSELQKEKDELQEAIAANSTSGAAADDDDAVVIDDGYDSDDSNFAALGGNGAHQINDDDDEEEQMVLDETDDEDEGMEEEEDY